MRNPQLPTGAYKTFKVSSPLATHYRRATCEEVNCEAYTNGWTINKADVTDQLMHVIKDSGRHYTEKTLELGGDIYLVFPPGQMCFAAMQHVVPLNRPEFYFAGRGDFRSFSVRRAHKYDRADQWQHDFAEVQDRNATLIQRG
jgi:hypothetical protein